MDNRIPISAKPGDKGQTGKEHDRDSDSMPARPAGEEQTTNLEDPRLYDIAREITNEFGMDWTDPRTGVTHKPKCDHKFVDSLTCIKCGWDPNA